MRIVFNLVVLYVAWFAAVWPAAANRPLAAAGASVVAIAINLAVTPRKAFTLKLILAAAVVGLATDGTLVRLGFTHFASPGAFPEWPPAWIILMWMAFATTLDVSVAWLQHRLLLAAMLGMIGGPLSYYAGARLGAMQFSQPIWLSLCAIGAAWALALPLLLFVARRTKPTQQLRN